MITPRLSGRMAIVTGAGSGIGKATAVRLAADGARVFGVDRMAAAGVDLVVDVASPGAAEAMVPPPRRSSAASTASSPAPASPARCGWRIMTTNFGIRRWR